MIWPRFDDSTLSSCSVPSTRRKADETTEFSRAWIPASAEPTA